MQMSRLLPRVWNYPIFIPEPKKLLFCHEGNTLTRTPSATSVRSPRGQTFVYFLTSRNAIDRSLFV